MVEDKIERQRDAVRAQHRGQLAQIINAAKVRAYGAIVHDRVPAVILARPRFQQRHQVQIGDAKLGKIVDPVGNSLQVACEKICIGGVSQHLLMLIPLRIGVPTQIEQPQVRRPLLEVLRRDLHQSVGHLRRMVGVGTGQAGQEVRPITLQSGRKDNLIMRRLALEQRRQIRNSHCWQAIGADVSLSAVCEVRAARDVGRPLAGDQPSRCESIRLGSVSEAARNCLGPSLMRLRNSSMKTSRSCVVVDHSAGAAQLALGHPLTDGQPGLAHGVGEGRRDPGADRSTNRRFLPRGSS